MTYTYDFHTPLTAEVLRKEAGWIPYTPGTYPFLSSSRRGYYLWLIREAEYGNSLSFYEHVEREQDIGVLLHCFFSDLSKHIQARKWEIWEKFGFLPKAIDYIQDFSSTGKNTIDHVRYIEDNETWVICMEEPGKEVIIHDSIMRSVIEEDWVDDVIVKDLVALTERKILITNPSLKGKRFSEAEVLNFILDMKGGNS